MFEENGICYADNREPTLKIIDVSFPGDWQMDALFNNGERRVTDFSPLLSSVAFAPLADKAAFKAGKLEYGTVTWCDGTIDIAPEWVLDHGRAMSKV
jgi:hypothetical protein